MEGLHIFSVLISGEVTVAFEKDLQEHYMCYDPMERLQLTNLSENKIFR